MQLDRDQDDLPTVHPMPRTRAHFRHTHLDGHRFSGQTIGELVPSLVGAMFDAFPILVLFFLFSKYYMEGASFSGLKG